uniref:Photosystem II 10 kDa polypeptide, chloroplastic n=1 Tax=Salix viminalis TaxID=40686 RepID=A0A6N2KW84_SALVM
MAASVMASLSLKPSPFTVEKSSVRGLPTLSWRSFKIESQRKRDFEKKILIGLEFHLLQTGTGGGMNLKNGLDASGRKPTVSVERVCTNLSTNMVLKWMDGYSPIYNADEWSPSGDVYAGGKTGLLIWAVTLAGILAGDALLVYSTSALAQ